MKTLFALMLAFYMVPANASQPTTFVVNSNDSFTVAINQVKQAAINHNFRVIRERDLSVNGVKIHAIWFCNFEMLNKAIHTHKKVGYLLPFRVTVEERNGKIRLTAANPDNSMKFTNAKLGKLCNTITADYKAILEEATL